ncbi:prepilin peptidase [Rhodococcus rhodnii]|uniref:Prepilin type IV endopeptidase peptidase domain-containing protein n=2 Tax=Rhodococcus rhodnii TaxID=38312 RepID=R7WKT5_9NOCA|nr:A24 family peptidase [Rhodococcus rhodnii]EOM75913.1 hypothetical protein Rrhod_2825 [Rhodococcus rhodnii LMG 5362]TXG91073.1 prepilin peptidase [Rhodococcus rhodnii]
MDPLPLATVAVALAAGAGIGRASRVYAARVTGAVPPPLVAESVGAAAGLVVGAWGLTVSAATAPLAAWCVVLTVCDLASRRLPNALTLGGAAAVALAGVVSARPTAVLLGAGLLGGAYLVVHVAAPGGLGGGDVKLAAPLGGVTMLAGPEQWVGAAIAAPLVTAAVGLAFVIARGRAGVRTPVPHGPAMCASTLVAVCVRPW